MHSSIIVSAFALLTCATSAMPFSPDVKDSTPLAFRSEPMSPSYAGHWRHRGRDSDRASDSPSRSAAIKASATSKRKHHAFGRRSNKKRCTKKSSNPASSASAGPGGASASSGDTTANAGSNSTSSSSPSGSSSSCFPALDFQMPSTPPSSSENWWCDQNDEYAFLGFSYDVSGCPSLSQLRTDFKNMRQTYGSRYVRSYNGCDDVGFNDKLVKAAWETGLGVHALIFFGYDGGDEWKSRKSQLLKTMKTNPTAAFVIRSIVVGSEPMFDYVLPPTQLADQIKDIKGQLQSVAPNTQVTLSDMPWAYSIQTPSDRKAVINAVDTLQGNILPFFDQAATTAADSWSNVLWNINYFKDNGNGKKILMTQTGWPSNQNTWPANSKNAVTSVKQEKDYFDLLDSKCTWMKKNGPQGGIGWFAHIYEDNTLPGWGVLKGGQPKFDFKPKTSC